MRTIERSALVPYAAERMYDIVQACERYPEFLPGCVGAVVHERSPELLLATLQLQRGPLRASFTTLNRLRRPDNITMELEDGPFEELRGEWQFVPVGSGECRITFRLSFSFSNPLRDALLGPAFESVCNGLVDAFVRRARELPA